MENEFGLPQSIINALEEKMDSFTFDSIVERLDSVFAKGWSFHFDGPTITEVPKLVPRYPKAKNPTAFKTEIVAHWQCQCVIEIITADKFNEIAREYSVCVPVSEPSSFEIARDMSFIYTAHYGLGVGRRSKDLFEQQDTKKIEVQIGDSNETITQSLEELRSLMIAMKITDKSLLDPYVHEFDHELQHFTDINRTNLRRFIAFLTDKLAGQTKPQ
jgi:hypothetical protein